MAIEQIESDQFTKTYLVLNAIKKRKIESLYKSFTRSSRSLALNNSDRSSNFYLNNYLVEKNLYELNQSELKRMDKSNIESISKFLDIFYFSEKLRFYSAALSQQSYLKEAYEIEFIEEFLEALEKSNISGTPSISIYHYCLLTVKENENIEHYRELRKLLSEHGTSFPINESQSLFYFAANYCIRKINKGELSFYDELFNVFQEMVEKEIILSEQGEISPWDFKNIVVNGLFLNKFNWTENFINDYGNKIPIQYRENSVRFNLGQLYFRQKKYQQVLEQLRDLEYDDLLASLNAKTITTMTFFEMDEFDLLFSYTESFRVYLGRKFKTKEIKKDRQMRYLNFLNLVRKLTKIFPGDQKIIERFERDLSENKQQGVVGSKWLSEKIAELK